MSKGRLVVWSHFVEGDNVLLGNDENMYGRFRVDVFKGEAGTVFEHNTRGKFFVDKPAEETSGHRGRSLLENPFPRRGAVTNCRHAVGNARGGVPCGKPTTHFRWVCDSTWNGTALATRT